MPFTDKKTKHECEGTIPNALGFSDKRGIQIADEIDEIIKARAEKVDKCTHGLDASMVLLELYEKYSDKELAFALFTFGRKVERLTSNPIERLMSELINSIDEE